MDSAAAKAAAMQYNYWCNRLCSTSSVGGRIKRRPITSVLADEQWAAHAVPATLNISTIIYQRTGSSAALTLHGQGKARWFQGKNRLNDSVAKQPTNRAKHDL